MTLHRVGVEASPEYRCGHSSSPSDRSRDGTERSPLSDGWGRDFNWEPRSSSRASHQLRFGIQDRLRDGKLARRHLTLDFQIATRVLVRVNGAADLLRRINDAHIGLEGDRSTSSSSVSTTTTGSPASTPPRSGRCLRRMHDQLEGRVTVSPDPVFSGWLAGGAQLHAEAITVDNAPPWVGEASATVREVAIRPLPWLVVQVSERFLGGTAGDKLMVGGSVGITLFGVGCGSRCGECTALRL